MRGAWSGGLPSSVSPPGAEEENAGASDRSEPRRSKSLRRSVRATRADVAAGTEHREHERRAAEATTPTAIDRQQTSRTPAKSAWTRCAVSKIGRSWRPDVVWGIRPSVRAGRDYDYAAVSTPNLERMPPGVDGDCLLVKFPAG